MERILLIALPSVSIESFLNPAFNERTVRKKSGTYGSIVADMPIGLLALSAYVKNKTAAEVKLIDFNTVLNRMDSFPFRSFAEFFRGFLSAPEWVAYNPTIIGISALFTPSYHNLLDFAAAARERFPHTLLVAGGGVPTNMYADIFKDSQCIDALCYGEGEKPFLGLVTAPDKSEFLRTSSAWITPENQGSQTGFQHEFIHHLDEIPFLDFAIINTADYQENSIQSLFPLAQKNRKSMPAITSRGCPHRCCFCSSHTVHGREMRYYSIPRIREDLQRLRDQYGAGTIVFYDDHFMAQKERVFDIIRVMKDLRLTAFFPSSLALYALDRQVLEAFKSIGVNHLILSIESGSQRVLREIMHKPLNLAKTKQIIADCRELDIATDVSILIGLPGETKQDLEDARIFLKDLHPTWFRISMATPLVGSEMFDICREKNYLKGDYLSGDFKKAIIETEDFSAEYIQETAYIFNLELNFVGNSDFKLGNYPTALIGFENVIKVKPDHAFAFYFAARCCRMLKLAEKQAAYNARYLEILAESAFWKRFADLFHLASPA